MKERITLTLDAEILKRLDQSIDGFHIKNRSHAVELLLLKAMEADICHQAVILAAGRHEGFTMPVGMQKVHNKPVIEHLIEMFRRYNIRDILIGISYQKEAIKEYFGSGSRFGVRIRYIEEDRPAGTLGTIRRAAMFLIGPFFVTNSDELKDVNLRDMYRVHRENNALATIALTTVRDPKKYGVVSLDGIRVREFQEKPRKGGHNLINAGLYLLELEVLKMIPEGQRMLYDFFPILAAQNKLIGYPFSGQWLDVSADYSRAAREWKY